MPYAWASVVFNVAAFLLFLFPQTRENFFTLNLGSFFMSVGVYFEKCMGLIVPGFSPSVLGEIYVYIPTLTEILIGAGIFGFGFLLYTVLCKITIGIYAGELSWAQLERYHEIQMSGATRRS